MSKVENVYIVVWTGTGRISQPKTSPYPYCFLNRQRANRYAKKLNNPKGIKGGIFKALGYLTGDQWIVKTLGIVD